MEDRDERFTAANADILAENVWADDAHSSVHCAGCGAPLAADARRCSACGTLHLTCTGVCSACFLKMCVRAEGRL